MFRPVSISLAAIGIASIVASSAVAAVPAKVTVGSSTTGNHVITASSTTAQVFSLSSGFGITCTAANVPAASTSPSVPGSFATAGASVSNVATINRVNYSSCNGSGLAFGEQHIGSWRIDVNSGATSATNDVVQGQINNVSARLFNLPSASFCDFTVGGSARVTLNEATQRLTVNEPIGGLLKVTSVVPNRTCGGAATVGASAKYTGTFHVTSPDGPINIG